MIEDPMGFLIEPAPRPQCERCEMLLTEKEHLTKSPALCLYLQLCVSCNNEFDALLKHDYGGALYNMDQEHDVLKAKASAISICFTGSGAERVDDVTEFLCTVDDFARDLRTRMRDEALKWIASGVPGAGEESS